MAKYTLPSYMSPQNIAVIEVMAAQKKPIKGPQLESLMKPKFKHNAGKALSSMKKYGYFENVEGGVVMTDHGRYIFDNKDRLVIRGHKSTGTIKRKKASRESESVEINVSNTALNLSNNISALLHENEQYRELLLKIYRTIGEALQLDNKGSE